MKIHLTCLSPEQHLNGNHAVSMLTLDDSSAEATETASPERYSIGRVYRFSPSISMALDPVLCWRLKITVQKPRR